MPSAGWRTLCAPTGSTSANNTSSSSMICKKPMARPCCSFVREILSALYGAEGRELIRTLHLGLLAEGIPVPPAKLCALFRVTRRTVYYKSTKAAPKVDPRFADPQGNHQLSAISHRRPNRGNSIWYIEVTAKWLEILG